MSTDKAYDRLHGADGHTQAVDRVPAEQVAASLALDRQDEVRVAYTLPQVALQEAAECVECGNYFSTDVDECPVCTKGCDCTELCSMGPTCPGGMLARLPGSGCWRGDATNKDRSVARLVERVRSAETALARVRSLAEYALSGSPYLISRDLIVADLHAALAAIGGVA